MSLDRSLADGPGAAASLTPATCVVKLLPSKGPSPTTTEEELSPTVNSEASEQQHAAARSADAAHAAMESEWGKAVDRLNNFFLFLQDLGVGAYQCRVCRFRPVAGPALPDQSRS